MLYHSNSVPCLLISFTFSNSVSISAVFGLSSNFSLFKNKCICLPVYSILFHQCLLFDSFSGLPGFLCILFCPYIIFNYSFPVFNHFLKYLFCTPYRFSSLQSLSRVWLCDPMDRSMPGLLAHHQLPEFIQTRVLWVSDAIQPSHPVSSPSPPANNLSQDQGLFKWASSLHQVAKYWSFSFSFSSSNEQSGMISFRIDW